MLMTRGGGGRGVLIIGRFPSDDAASMAVKGLTYTETIKLICDVEKGRGGWVISSVQDGTV